MDKKYTPQEAYEEDVRRCPFYHDGDDRKEWDHLADWVKGSWMRNPTPRTFKHLTLDERLAT